MECIFCNIVQGKIPSYKVWENEEFLAFLDINPIMKGHLLLIPKRHYSYVFEMPEDEYIKLMKTAKQLSSPLRRFFKAKRIGLIIEGLEVEHAHIHLVPINNIGELNPANSKKGNSEELKILAEELSKSFKDI
ncbi:MAG: histidine triad family protein [Candidatus Woesearchaeota archaeon]|nr:histidine triad family protein [Candidatus Woesearchaeota archaeon]